MEFNRRRITNGLAWAGAALIVAIPAADLIARQFSPGAEPQVAVVQDAPVSAAPELPTPATDRPAPTTTTPAQTATNTASTGTSGDAVDSFIESGRPLPSYISNGGGTPATPATNPAPAATPSPASTTPPVQTAAVPPQQTQTTTPAPAATRPVITAPRAVTGFPTPVSERPRIATAPVPVPAPVVTQPAAPPLIINQPGPVVTADDLNDWESGPLSEFLANRGGQQAAQPQGDYNPNGFWLDQRPQGNSRPVYPPAYDDTYYYPFGQ